MRGVRWHRCPGNTIEGTGRPGAGEPPSCSTTTPLAPAQLVVPTPLIGEPHEPAPPSVPHTAVALRAHLAAAYGSMPPPVSSQAGGLAPWQQRRAEDMLRAGVAGGVRLDEVARRCNLSLSQFGRTFKKTTGLTPHRWLVQRRLERAQDLLLWSTLSLAQIALDCGFSEQSHFTRTFTRLVGTSPGEWRRQRRR
jgi:AraC family transcriptional regulator